MNRRTTIELGVFVLLVALGAASRLAREVWHDIPPNVHCVTAAALLAGFYFRSRAVAACVPLLAVLLSDQVLGGYDTEVMLAVYAATLLPLVWRGWLHTRLSPIRLGLAAGASSILFFLITNFAVWHACCWYPHTWAGLSQCYASALPFLRYALVGDLAATAAVFGAYTMVAARTVVAARTATSQRAALAG